MSAKLFILFTSVLNACVLKHTYDIAVANQGHELELQKLSWN